MGKSHSILCPSPPCLCVQSWSFIQPITSKQEDASRNQAGHINARHLSSGNHANWRTRDQWEKAKRDSTFALEARSLDYLMPLQFESFFVFFVCSEAMPHSHLTKGWESQQTDFKSLLSTLCETEQFVHLSVPLFLYTCLREVFEKLMNYSWTMTWKTIGAICEN